MVVWNCCSIAPKNSILSRDPLACFRPRAQLPPGQYNQTSENLLWLVKTGTWPTTGLSSSKVSLNSCWTNSVRGSITADPYNKDWNPPITADHPFSNQFKMATYCHHPWLSCLEAAWWILVYGTASCSHQDIHLEHDWYNTIKISHSMIVCFNLEHGTLVGNMLSP